MSKNRLDESQIRRMMGLANLGPLGESFLTRTDVQEQEEVEEMKYRREEDEEEMDEKKHYRREDDDEMKEEMEMDDEPEMGADEPEMGAEEPAAEAATDMAMDVADAVADALTDALAAHGVEVTAGEAAPEMDAEPEMEMGDEPAPEMDAEPEMDDLDDLEEAGIELVNDEHLVQEVARRVAKRLLDRAKN